MQWDYQVDVVAVGAGLGGLATAIVAVDDGQTVFVTQSPVRSPHHRLGVEVSDRATNAYLDAVTDIVGTPAEGTAGDLPVRLVASMVPVSLGCNPRRNGVEPFSGARLAAWSADCIVAPHGVFYSYVAHRDMTTLHSATGEKVEVAVVGSVEPGVGPEWCLDEWLSAQARDRGIEARQDSTLDRLVFENGQVVGAVLATPDGRCAVSAARGVVVATSGGATAGGGVAHRIPGDDPVQVGVVSKPASRFARVELLTPVRADIRPSPTPANHGRLRSHTLSSRAGCHTGAPGQLHDGGI